MRLIDSNCKIIYWHRELPPLDAVALDEYVVEAESSPRSGYSLASRRIVEPVL